MADAQDGVADGVGAALGGRPRPLAGPGQISRGAGYSLDLVGDALNRLASHLDLSGLAIGAAGDALDRALQLGHRSVRQPNLGDRGPRTVVDVNGSVLDLSDQSPQAG